MGKQGHKMGLDITYDKTKLSVVKLNDVRPNSWNPKEKDSPVVKRIEQNIQRIGFNEPIRVRENNGFEIIDGEQRWTAARNLGLKEVLIYNEGKVSDKEARNATLWWQVQVPFDDIKLAYEVAQLSNEDVELPYTAEEIEDFKAMANFDFEQYATERPEDELDGVKTLKIVLGEEAYNVIMQAISQVQAEHDNISEARAVELICADYLAN
jgi:hypothetical protein